MKAALTSIVICCLTVLSQAGNVDLRYGTIDVPDGFEFRRLTGIDSFVANIVRTNDGFTIHCDIGAMAGHRVGPQDVRYTFRRLHTVGEVYACTGIQDQPKGKRIVTTVSSLLFAQVVQQAERDGEDVAELQRLQDRLSRILEEHKSGADVPANFVADCRDVADFIDFMLIVATYRTKNIGPSNNHGESMVHETD